MRTLTFLAFLKKYMKDVSGHSTLSIHRLCKESKKNYRIIDPLILYCSLTSKKDIFNKYFGNKHFDVVGKLNETNFLDDEFRDFEFKKIWEAYQIRLKKTEFLMMFKGEIRERTISNLKKNNISNYRVYTDLKLNPGNINDYLTNGNCNKVSLKVAKQIYAYSIKSN